MDLSIKGKFTDIDILKKSPVLSTKSYANAYQKKLITRINIFCTLIE